MAHAQHSPFLPRAEVSFPRAHQFSELNGKEVSARLAGENFSRNPSEKGALTEKKI